MDNTSSKGKNYYTSEDLRSVFRMLWNQYVMWTRFYIISRISNINDIEVVKNRLLEIPRDFSNVFKIYYGNTFGKTIEHLIRNHINLFIELVDVLIVGNTTKEKTLKEELYKNATILSTFLSQSNPNWDQKELQNLLVQQTEMTMDEIKRRINMEYVSDIFQYDYIEYHALMLADVLWKGIINQFYD